MNIFKKDKKQPLIKDLPSRRLPVHLDFVRRALAIMISISGLASVLSSTRLLHGGMVVHVGFGPASAWLSQHNIVVGFMLLYLARQIYNGERTAYLLSVILMVSQVFKYAFIEQHFIACAIYATLLIILLSSQEYFLRYSSPRRFVSRIKSVVLALIVSIFIITLLGVVFRLGRPDVWKNSSYSASRVVMRATLLEFNSDGDDPLPARFFGQLLTAAGFAMYAWILAGLFSPALYSRSHADETEREHMHALLNKYGRTSEDSFKLWPMDKKYWFNANDTAGIAYKQYRGLVVALDAPVGTVHACTSAATDFRNYCRQHGWKLVWLFADNQSAETNKLKTLKIGANAVVNLEQYATSTIKNKWWRWIRNKNRKLGLVYEQLGAHIDDDTMTQLKEVSDIWMSNNNHNEWTFALGYFDEAFMRKCTLHILRNETGKIVAFANQLPSFNQSTQATIDLMRSMPEYDGAITYLLSEALLNMHNESYFETFDLGFVPLAQEEQKAAKKAVLALTKTLFNAYFSAIGLRQFKNKFEPTWHDNYLAWDGDWLDLPAITQAIDKVLEYKADFTN